MSPDAEPTLLTEVAMIEEIFETSHARPVLLFKHSLTCPISSAAHREFRRLLAAPPGGDAVRFALIEIQNARPVSNAVAERSGVRHESPQAILLAGGRVAWSASHGAIREASLRAALERAINGAGE